MQQKTEGRMANAKHPRSPRRDMPIFRKSERRSRPERSRTMDNDNLTPGSSTALEAGCTCSTIVNGGGDGLTGPIPYAAADCPLHGLGLVFNALRDAEPSLGDLPEVDPIGPRS